MRSINLLILFGMRRNCRRSGISRSLYLFIRKVIKQIVIIITAYHFANYEQNSAVKVNSLCRGNYWRSSVWISKQQLNYWPYILHSSNTREKMGIQ